MTDKHLTMPDYPWFENSVLKRDDEGLARHAANYLATTTDEVSAERFLFGYLPVVVFAELLDQDAQPDLGSSLWMMHLSGYFGGRWLRGEIAAAQPQAMLVSFSLPPSQEAFNVPIARVTDLMAKANSTDADALAAAHKSLFDEPSSVEGAEPIRGLGDTFGYNAGYMLEILAAPPVGIAVPDRFQVTCSRLMSCDYASPKLAAIAKLRPIAEALDRGDAGYKELNNALQSIQSEGIVRGRAVWSTGLSVQGFGQVAYDQLLDVSSSFLETVEATALTMVSAAVNANAVQARVGARAHSAMVVWLASYMAGLLNGEGTIEIPQLPS